MLIYKEEVMSIDNTSAKKRRKQEKAERKAREEELKKLRQAIQSRHGETDGQRQGEAEG